MAATHPHAHEHHEPLDRVALSATLHCLTGCAIGEVAGMVLGTALGLSNWPTVALSVALAFVFGYGLTSLPLLRAGLAFGAVVPIALASDTLSIATMEIVDNAIVVAIPGALGAGLGALLFWGSLSASLVIAGVAAFPVNRWLLARGKGHAAVHETGIHGGPPTRLVAAVAVAAGAFGFAVLLAQVV
jgi:formate/nitrite transporter FocA (FNT family)